MTTQLPLKTDYQAVRAQLEQAFSKNLAEVEAQALAKMPKAVAEEMSGGYVRDVSALVSLFTPDYFAECVEAYDGDTAEHEFFDFCISEMNETIAYLALCAWPKVVGGDTAWGALSFALEQQWSDKVSFKDEEETSHHVMAETDDEALLEAWGSYTPEPRVNGLDEGHDYFLVYDENDGEPKPALGREMTKKFRLMFDEPDAELESFTASLVEAGFAPVFSEQVEYNNSPDEAQVVDEVAF